MSTTKDWALRYGICIDENLEPVADFTESYARTASEIAIRTVILQGVAAVAYNVDAEAVVEWLQEQDLWAAVTPVERAFLLGTDPTEAEQLRFRWQQETQWTLLWMIGRVESLGLPTRSCDTGRLVDEIMPGLGDEVQTFIGLANLRSPGALLAEDDRTYDLWCRAHGARRLGESLPIDLNLGVLRERRYAFEWMDGNQDWDHVTCDS